MDLSWHALVYVMIGLTSMQIYVAHAGAEKPSIGSDSRQKIHQLILQGQLIRNGDGPPQRLHVVMTNASSHKVCIAVEQDGWGVVGLQPAFVGSFGRLEDTVKPFAEDNGEYEVKVLIPGQHEIFDFDLAGRYQNWINDHYTLVLRYAPTQALLRNMSADASQRQCKLVAGPILAAPTSFKVANVPGSESQNHYTNLWRSDAPVGERWKALMWLGRNALTVGMHRSEVLALLGEPSEVRDSSQWIFSLGSDGFKVIFADERVAKVEFFIS